MKIRNGFVSNSSSSSFVIIGKSVTIAEAIRSNSENIIGVFNGEMVCKLNKSMLNILQKEINRDFGAISVDLIDSVFYEQIEEGGLVDREIDIDIPKGSRIFSTTVTDCYPPRTEEELLDYLDI